MDLELSPLHPQDSNDINPHAVQPGIFQPVVIVQPSECMSHEPPAEPVPDYMCYSKFAMFMCVCLGCAAVYFSRAVSIHLFTFGCILLPFAQKPFLL